MTTGRHDGAGGAGAADVAVARLQSVGQGALRSGLAVERVARSGVARLLRPKRTDAAEPVRSTAPAAQACRPTARWRPTVVGGELVQPDNTTCGPSALVMARLINDASYRAALVDQHGVVDRSAFVREVRAVHRSTSWVRDHGGRLQLPWVPLLGTTPWATARAMSGTDGAGAGYWHRVLPFDPADRSVVLAAVVSAVERGHVVPLFIGSPTMARHVVLVTGTGAATATGTGTGTATDPSASSEPVAFSSMTTLDVYDPASGRWQHVDQDELRAGRAVIAGWSEPWFAIVAEEQPAPGIS